MDTLVLPPSGPGKSNETWTAVQSVVVTGANGSGKTRFGRNGRPTSIMGGHRSYFRLPEAVLDKSVAAQKVHLAVQPRLV